EFGLYCNRIIAQYNRKCSCYISSTNYGNFDSAVYNKVKLETKEQTTILKKEKAVILILLFLFVSRETNT
ncbi:MAG: hypothetical protein DBX37_00345, partial [Massilioclostridium sp.]